MSSTTATLTSPTVLPGQVEAPAPAPAHVARPRLTAALDDGVRAHALTVVMGPAGAGKTTLLAEWAQASRAGWVTLGPADDRPDRFWALLHQAAGMEPVGDDAAGALVRHAAAQPAPVVVVLDGFESIADPTTLDEVVRLVRNAPPNLRFVLGARSTHRALHLTRLRVEGAAVLIGPDVLQLTRDETAAVLAAGGLGDDAALAQKVWERTQGWPAAVRLTAIALDDHDDRPAFADRLCGTEPVLSDYIDEELLDPVDADLLDFLLHTSVLDEVTSDLATALTDRAGVSLGALQRRGFPMAASSDGSGAFRHHPLVAGRLRAALARQDGRLEHTLHRRAAEWFGAHGPAQHAVDHAVRSADPALLDGIVAAHVVAALCDGVLPDFVARLDGLTPQQVQAAPSVARALAIAAYAVGDVEAGDRHLPDDGDRGDAAVVAHLLRALATGSEPLPDEPDATREAAGPILALDGMVRLWAGDTTGAETALARAATRTEGRDGLGGAVAACLAVCRLRHGAPQDAAQLARAALALTDRTQRRTEIEAAIALTVLGVASLDEGDGPTAAAAFTEAGQIVDAGPRSLPGSRAFIAGKRSTWLCLVGRPAEGLACLEAVDPAALSRAARPLFQRDWALAMGACGRGDEALARLDAGDALLSARLHLLAGDPAPALRLDEDPSASTTVEQHLTIALAHDGCGATADADAAIADALTLAGPEAGCRPFLTHGDALAPLLRRAAHHASPQRALAARLAAALESGHDLPAAPLVADPHVEPLSEAELAIVRYLPTRLTNGEIAGERCLSVNTIKTHLKQIYRKLGVGSRSEAVLRARALGLVPVC